MKILVTGGAGFIGAHLTKALIEQGQAVVVIDDLNDYYDPQLKKDRLEKFLSKDKFVFLPVDITVQPELEAVFANFDFEVVCHLAAYAGLRHSIENPFIYHHNNVSGTYNILELIRKYHVKKLVMASSSSVYGDSKLIPFSESDPLGNLLSPYAVTKRINELTCFDYHQGYGLPIVLLRFFNVYGPWSRPDLAFYKFAALIRAGQPIDIYNFGKMQRDYTYIDDIVNGISAAIQRDLGFKIINLGNNQPVMLDEVVALLEEYLGQTASKNYLPMQSGDVTVSNANISQARRWLDFDPTVKIAVGLKKFVNWFNDYYQPSS